MVKKFADLKGKATKVGPDRLKFVDGINQFRMVSPVVPGYKYWLKTKDGMTVPMDCLSFDREEEAFTNKVKDWVRHFFPDKKCSWAYSSFVIDRTDNKLKIIDHKKRLFQQIIKAAESLGDPTDLEDGWDIIVERKRTGPRPFDVEYQLEHFKIKNSPLSDKDRELLEEMPDIEKHLTLPKEEDQKSFIENFILGETEHEEDVGEEVKTELKTGTDDLTV